MTQSTREIEIPLTGAIMSSIGASVEKIIERLRILEDGESSATGLMPEVGGVVVGVANPDGFGDEIVGEIRWHPDGWWAYYPFPVKGDH